MNIILFGPPGVGKSTLIGILKSNSFRAIDLEDVYPSNIRFHMPSELKDVTLAAADLNPQRKYTNCKKVLLWAEQKVYDARRAARDIVFPKKANQKLHSMEAWLRGCAYDYIIDTTGLTSRETAQRIIDVILKERSDSYESKE